MKQMKAWIKKITTNKSIGQLIFRCIMMVLVPYIYLIICGILDRILLNMGYTFREGFILFVFFSLMTFWLIGFILIGISIYKWYRKGKVKAKK